MVETAGHDLEADNKSGRSEYGLLCAGRCQPRSVDADQLGSAAYRAHAAAGFRSVAQIKALHRAGQDGNRTRNELVHAAAGGRQNHCRSTCADFSRPRRMIAERSSNVRWFLVCGLFVLSAVAFLDRVNISIAGSSIASEFGLSDVHLGWVFSSFLLGYALFQTPGGWLADKWGSRRVLAAGVIWWGI